MVPVTEREILALKQKYIEARDSKIQAEATMVEVNKTIDSRVLELVELGGCDDPEKNDAKIQELKDECSQLYQETQKIIENWYK